MVDRIPNTDVGLEASSHSLLFNVQITFGGAWGRKPDSVPVGEVYEPTARLAGPATPAPATRVELPGGAAPQVAR